MELFLIITALIFLFFGSLFLLFPDVVRMMSASLNRAVFDMEKNMPVSRKPLGIIMLALSIILWYIGLWK